MDLESVEKHYPVIETLRVSLKDMTQKPDLNPQHLFRWMKKLESFMSMETAKVRNKPNRATKISLLVKQLISHCKLSTLILLKEEIMKMYPLLALLISYYLNIVFRSSLYRKNKKDNEVDVITTYSFVKLMLNDSPESILDAILCSTIGESASENGFDKKFLDLVVRDKYLYDKSNECLLKYLGVVSLMKECGYSIVVFKEVIKNYPYIPKDFNLYLTQNLQLSIRDNDFSLQSIVKAILSRRVIQMCKTRITAIPSNVVGEAEDEEDCESEDTVSVGDDDTAVSSTNPDFNFPIAAIDCDYDSDESQEQNSNMENGDTNINSDCEWEDQNDEFNSDEEVSKNSAITQNFVKTSYSSSDKSDSSVIFEEDENKQFSTNAVPSTVPKVTTVTEDPKDSSDDEIGIVFEKTVEHDQTRWLQAGMRLNTNDRDEASPESGEDDFPVYSPNEFDDDDDSISADSDVDLPNPNVLASAFSSNSVEIGQNIQMAIETTEGDLPEIIDETENFEVDAHENERVVSTEAPESSTISNDDHPKDSNSDPTTSARTTRSKIAKETKISSSQPDMFVKKQTVNRKSRATSESRTVSPKRARTRSLLTAPVNLIESANFSEKRNSTNKTVKSTTSSSGVGSKKSQTETGKSPSGTSKSSNKASKSPALTRKLSTATRKSPAVAKKSPAVAKKSPAVASKSPTGTSKSSNKASKSPTGASKPSNKASKSPAVTTSMTPNPSRKSSRVRKDS